jgi:hypothetical protein
VAFARPESFPRLSKRANLTHAVLTYHLSREAEDKVIFEVAKREERFALTINYKHFKRFVTSRSVGIIAIPGELTNEEIDKLVTEFITGKNPDDYYGKAIKISL